ncbi:hypothetical protein ACEQUB_01052 [Ralstonia syzygii]
MRLEPEMSSAQMRRDLTVSVCGKLPWPQDDSVIELWNPSNQLGRLLRAEVLELVFRKGFRL